MSKKPVIGITAAHCTEELQTFPRESYVKCIWQSGGIPFLIPPVSTSEESAAVLSVIDGLLLSGGGDISPYLLHEDPLPGIGNCLPERDCSELLLARAALAADIPLLGICRGLQVMAAAAGGKIAQDIAVLYPDRLQHSQKAPRSAPWHKVHIQESSYLRRIVGEEQIGVNSFHHQAVSVVPEGFTANALAPDGIIEGIERRTGTFCLGVQWHPESMGDERHSQNLFAEFIRASGQDATFCS